MVAEDFDLLAIAWQLGSHARGLAATIGIGVFTGDELLPGPDHQARPSELAPLAP